MATAAPSFGICGVLSESRRIIKAYSRHFRALSALFLLPLSFSLFIYPTLQSTLSEPHIKPIQIKTLALPLIYSLFVFILSLCAVGSITYSTHHGFYGRSVELVSSIKSLSHTFIPLAATTVVSEVIVILIAVAFVLFVGLVSKGIELFLGYEMIDHNNSDYFTWFRAVVLIIFVVVVLYIKVNWSLASVIVVVEMESSKWGLEALRRSKYLVRGMRWVSFLIMYLYGSTIGLFVWGYSDWGMRNSGGFSWWSVAKTLLGSGFVTMFMLSYMTSFAVLYMYCKSMHGELAWEIAESTAKEYVSLPFDDDKVPDHVVDVAQS